MRRFPPSAIKVTVFAVLTFAMIGLLGTVIGNISFQDRHDYSALFADATAVESGETVRLAGVPVGTVTSTEVVDSGDTRLAKVNFTVDQALPVFTDAQLQLRYENLVGRRYLAIVERPSDGAKMPPGGTFPLSQTRPALNLTVLFNGFQPLFQALEPQQVNQLSYEIIQTLQGEGRDKWFTVTFKPAGPAEPPFSFVVNPPARVLPGAPIPASVTCRYIGANTRQYCEYRAAW